MHVHGLEQARHAVEKLFVLKSNIQFSYNAIIQGSKVLITSRVNIIAASKHRVLSVCRFSVAWVKSIQDFFNVPSLGLHQLCQPPSIIIKPHTSQLSNNLLNGILWCMKRCENK